MRLVRTWLPVAIISAGVVLALIVQSESGLEGGVLLISAGLSVWLINLLYRVGVQGDREREDEDEARRYYDEHGHWPDEGPPGPRRTSAHRVARPDPRHQQRRRP
jgi:hypothetical protein